MKKKRFVLLVAWLLASGALLATPRPEYPRMQFERSEWINLNGLWSYTFDMADSGMARGLNGSKGFDDTIMVPFCPESRLSGVAYNDFITAMWYQRTIEIPQSWSDKRVIINFGAVYYQSELFIDGKFVGRHFGGTSSFGYDISSFVEAGQKHSVVVHVRSDLRQKMQPAGKQSTQYRSHDCDYTRCTGIWQTVWLEAAATEGLKSVQTFTDIDNKQLVVNPTYYAQARGNKLRVSLMAEGRKVAAVSVAAGNGSVAVIPIKNMRLWSPTDPFLYDVLYEVVDGNGRVVDSVRSYVGMRKIHIEGTKLYLNNEPIFLRMVLDQGFYPDGIWTAPSDEALKRDIQLSLSCGFNGARLHQKVFEERFHYWADRMGYLTCGEAASWGLDYNIAFAARVFMPEWQEIVERDRNHPSIIMWVPNNEQNNVDRVNFPRYMDDMYRLTKSIDPTRPFHGNSGGMHFATDIYSKHSYAQNPTDLRNDIFKDGKMAECYKSVLAAHLILNTGSNFPDYNDGFQEITYQQQMPYFLDEYGGVSFNTSGGGWGYGGAGSREEFYAKVEALTDVMLDLADFITGYCYTQLTDVEQEQNGLFKYDRSEKFDTERIKAIFAKQPNKQ